MGFACTLWQVQSSKFKPSTVKIGNAPWSSPKMNLRFIVIPGKWTVFRMWDQVRATWKSLPTRESHQYVGSHENYIINVLWCVQFYFKEMSCKVLPTQVFKLLTRQFFSKKLDGMFSQGLGIKSSSLVYTMVWGCTWGRWENDQWKIGNNLMKNFISTLAIYFALMLITLTIMLISMQLHRDLRIWWSSLGIKCSPQQHSAKVPRVLQVQAYKGLELYYKCCMLWEPNSFGWISIYIGTTKGWRIWWPQGEWRTWVVKLSRLG